MGLGWLIEPEIIMLKSDVADQEWATFESALMYESVGMYLTFRNLQTGLIDAAIKYLERHLKETSKAAGQEQKCAKMQLLLEWLKPIGMTGHNYRHGDTGELMRTLAYHQDRSRFDEDSKETVSDFAPILQKPDEKLAQVIVDLGLWGLWLFMSHSYCDGEFSPWEAKMVLATYELLHSYIEPENDFNKWLYHLAPVLECSVKHQRPIQFV